ncbi:MAG: S8 family serine peptidase [Pirellulales bacterium]|nr:S8 family serine peptidase [Pirellulales bacterium]
MAPITKWTVGGFLIVVVSFAQTYASQDTIGLNGINSAGLTTANGLPLNGGAVASVDPVAIGQVESFRPGDNSFDTDPTLRNATVDPAGVFFLKQGPPITYNATSNTASEIGPPPYPFPANAGHHSIGVAGVMISTAMDTPNTPITPTGVSLGAQLYSIGQESTGTDDDAYLALASQQIALLPGVPGVDVRAINMSVNVTSSSGASDGNSLMTLFLDWSASAHDVLYVVAGTELATGGPTGAPAPTDNFNGITVAYSAKVGGTGMYRQVGTFNTFNEDADGARTSVDIMAPGDMVDTVGRGTARLVSTGTSFAAPHVTSTVALLQQYANERIVNGGWNAVNSRRHETMKAVLLNSADKIKDDGTRTVNGIPVPMGGFLGMDRTVLDKNGNDWLASPAFLDNLPMSLDNGLVALDEQMGAGELDAKRAVQQFAPGDFNNTGTATVPAIGWDYGHTNGLNSNIKYKFSQQLVAGSFLSITVAFDRKVVFDTDSGTVGKFDFGDSFQESTSFVPGQDQTNDLDLFLLPLNAPNTDNPIAFSQSSDDSVEHLFAQIPTTGMYEFWVHQFDNDLGDGQDYAVAWWADFVASGTTMGDYNGDHVVDATDYTVWRGVYGNSVTAGTGADGNGNGVIDAADYVIWRDHLGQMVGSGSTAAIPEPSCLALLTVVGVLAACKRRT